MSSELWTDPYSPESEETFELFCKEIGWEMGSKYYFEDKASQISLQYFLTYFFRNPTSFKYLAENNTIILKTDDYRE